MSEDQIDQVSLFESHLTTDMKVLAVQGCPQSPAFFCRQNQKH